MADTNKPDLRDGKPHAAPTSESVLPGHTAKVMPLPSSGEHAVNPGVGSKAGVAEGQVTKSN